MPTGLLERKEILDDSATLAISEVVNVWDAALGLPSEDFRSVMVGSIPVITDPYAAGASSLGAAWYNETAPNLPYRAVPSALPARERLLTSAEWAMGASGSDALSRLAGIVQKAIWDSNRRTIFDNSKAERGAKYERVAGGKCCAFCAMLCTRGAVYLKSTAGFQAHDNCRCGAQEVRPGKSFSRPSHYERFDEAYIQASKNATGTDAILAEMRTILGSS
ncbi:hypothetical protein [Rhodococcus globerulus]|uniref:VG15 protein n=1 Tax=Rhodococcus globerulus TaxID=33008 RepID=UPI001C597590|nr:hypothetical protein [Rhodococcus globerulus]QXW04018.1 hypothetical protein KYT97_08360 [Rhodococcus globerulus]